MNVDDGLEDIRWFRGLGGERSPAASYALLRNLKKISIFCHRREIVIFCPLFSTHQPPNVFVSDAWPAPATHHRPCCEHWPEGGSELLTSAPRSNFMTQSLVLSFDVCRGLGISPLRIKLLAEFFSGRSWPNICPGLFFSVFFSKFGTFFVKLCAHSERYRNLMAGIHSFFWQHRVSIKIGLNPLRSAIPLWGRNASNLTHIYYW